MLRIEGKRVMLDQVPSVEGSVERSLNISSDSVGETKDVITE